MSELTSKQKKACELLVANPEMKLQDVALEVGVNRVTLWRWTEKPEWQEYEHKLCNKRFKSLEKLAIEKLKQNATNNNQKAIEYILDYIGYKPKEEIDLNTDFEINITE